MYFGANLQAMWMKFSTTCPASLYDSWKQLSLPVRQCPHTCNIARNYSQAGHIPTDPADTSPNHHLWDVRDWRVHDLYTFSAG